MIRRHVNDDRVRTGGFVGFAVLAAMAVTNARVLSPDTFYTLYSVGSSCSTDCPAPIR